MLSAKSKAERHELRCAAMRERKELARIEANRKRMRKNSRNFNARQRAKRGPSPVVRRSREEIRRCEENGFARIKRYLDREAKEMAEERYVTALYGVKTSWAAIEESFIYGIWRRRAGVRTRESTSLRPNNLWLNSPSPPLTSIDRHHVGWHLVAPRKVA